MSGWRPGGCCGCRPCWTGRARDSRGSRPGGVRQGGEGGIEGALAEPAASCREEEGGRGRVRPALVAAARIGAKRGHRGGVQRQLPRLAGLRPGDHDPSRGQVDVVPVEPDDLSRSHAGHREQADHRLGGGRADAWPEPPGLGHEGLDVAGGVDARREPPVPFGHRVGRRHLAAPVEKPEVGGEPAGDAESHSVP